MRLKTVIGLVPPDIRLNRRMLSATNWLGDFTDEDIEELPKSVREMGLKAEPDERRRFMGDYWTDPHRTAFGISFEKLNACYNVSYGTESGESGSDSNSLIPYEWTWPKTF